MEPKQTGKILRVKTGYNPNSSSVGSQIPAFLFFAVGTGAVSVMITQLFHVIDRTIRAKKQPAEGGAPE